MSANVFQISFRKTTVRPDTGHHGLVSQRFMMKWLYVKNRGHKLEIPARWWLGTLAMLLFAWKGADAVPSLSLILRLATAVLPSG